MKGTRLLLVSMLCIALFGVTSALAGPSDGRKAVGLNQEADISGLPVTKDDIRISDKKAATQVKTVYFKLDTSACSIYPAPEGYDYLDANGLKPQGKPGEPQIPMKTFVVELDKDAQVYGVEVVKGKYSEVKQDVNLVPMPEPSTYKDASEGGKFVADDNIYSQETRFPGKLVSFDTGKDNNKQYVYVRLFPLQVTPKKHKVELLTEATINVYYCYGTPTKNGGNVPAAPNQPPQPPPIGPGKQVATTVASSIVICPAALSTQATILADFHTTTEGIPSVVVTTEDIATSYPTPAEEPAYSGYNNPSNSGYSNIKNYNYFLARQIIAYLRDTAMHPNLIYVTVLGDAGLVPPSYYAFDLDAIGLGGGTYDQWLPTDIYYTSPDYDFTPNYRVGRLPVSNSTEALAMVNKIIAWYASANWSWFGKAYLVGGIVHTNHLYCGELNITEEINKGYFAGMNIVKCFKSDDKEGLAFFEPCVRDGNVGFVFYEEHSGPDHPSLDGVATIYSADVLAYTTTVANVPIWISEGCYMGAWDIDLYPQRRWSANTSFSAALLQSKAGAIAYFGGTRLTTGDALFHYDQGRVVVDKQTNMLEILSYALASYRQGATDLGQLYVEAINSYIAVNDTTGYDGEVIDSLFELALLGDPALKIPVIVPVAEKTQAVVAAQNPVVYDAENIPQFNGPPVTVTATTNSPTVKWKLIDIATKTVLEPNVTDYGPSFSRTYSQSAQQQYLVRTSTENTVPSVDYTKEGWLLYNISANAGKIMHVSNINITVTTQGKNKFATAVVTVLDQVGAAVSGATVSGQWNGLTSDTDTGTTNASGQVTVTSNSVPKGTSGTFGFCVTNVALSGATYDPNANVETCDSILSQLF